MENFIQKTENFSISDQKVSLSIESLLQREGITEEKKPELSILQDGYTFDTKSKFAKVDFYNDLLPNKRVETKHTDEAGPTFIVAPSMAERAKQEFYESRITHTHIQEIVDLKQVNASISLAIIRKTDVEENRRRIESKSGVNCIVVYDEDRTLCSSPYLAFESERAATWGWGGATQVPARHFMNPALKFVSVESVAYNHPRIEIVLKTESEELVKYDLEIDEEGKEKQV